VTACVTCGAKIDYRPMRPKDEPSGEHDPLVEVESAKTGPPPPTRQEQKRQEVEENMAAELAIISKPAPASHDPWAKPCSKHGGATEPCDVGRGKANKCVNSKWGKNRTHDGPCACFPCHSWAQPGQPAPQ
jgi:hypothetical protein